ncbi:ATP-binding protein [Ideonella sp.]|uniref:ATP-binding protein n=1 Tax=Ideonella sp. TaxID=1929293 RepID=UPI002B471150|nr:AAA family ATPase [Ideonella sp.]HJV72318.1 AAA family ATPase [Ideonella sp.]
MHPSAVEAADEAAGAAGVLAFGTFRLDPRNALLNDGERELELPPKAFAVLCHLAARPGLLVTKDDLLDAVWGHRFVSESVLKTAVSTIRTVLGDDSRMPRYVETVSRRGYRFVAALVDQAAPALPAEPARAEALPAPAPAVVPLPAPDGAPLIGRGAELARLGALLGAAMAGTRQMVLVGGEAGIGKSALLRRLAEQAQAAGAQVALGQCIEQVGGGEPYLPVLDALAELSRGPEGAPWVGALRQVAPTWLAQLPWLVAPGDQASLRHELAGAVQDRMLREFGALLDVVTPARPLVLLIEDLHWSDHATVNLLGYLARRRGPARTMLVASYRPIDAALSEHPMQALRQELRLHKLCTELMLEPFSELDVDHYLRERLGAAMPARHEAWARLLHGHTEGLPLFVANLVDDLEGSGAFEDAADPAADPAALLARLQVPDTLSGVIERQIARLPGEWRALLEAAAVLGMEFAHPALAALLGQDGAALRARCDGLVRRAEWLRSAGLATLPDGSLAARFAFRHALHRRVFYERLSAAQRLQLHLQAAQALQTLLGAHADRNAAEVALHLESACETAPLAGVLLPAVARDAVAWRLRAAQAAVALHAPHDALAHLARAWCSGPSAAERVHIGLERAGLLQQLGCGAQALSESAAALDEARALGDTPLLQRALRVRARCCQENDLPDEAIGLIDELLAGSAAPTGAERARALMVKAQAMVGAGRLADAAAVSQNALDAVPAEAPAVRADILAGQVLGHFHRATFAEGLATAERAMALYEQVGDALGAAQMAGRRGAFLLNLERADEAEAALRDARARSMALHDVQGHRTAVLNLVKVLTDRGDAASALALLDEGWQAAPGFESPIAECAFLHGFYYCNYLRGELGAAFEDAGRVRASAEGLNSVYWRIGSSVLVVGIYTHLGDLATAGEMVEQALALAHAREVHHLWPRVVGHRAWLDVLAGEPTRALARLDEVIASGDPVPAEDFAAMQRVRAKAQLALGQPHDALATLAPFDGAPTQEAWALMLALRLQAQQRAHGASAPADLARARADLSDNRLPALESLLLRQALVDALQVAGRPAEAEEQARLAADQRARLAASLHAWPDHQAAFLRRFAAPAR